MAGRGQGKELLTVELTGWRSRRGQFAAASDGARADLRRTMRAEGQTLRRLAIAESPAGTAVRSRRFRDRWHYSVQETATGGEGVLWNDAPYAPYVIFPTRPHLIRPRRARLLRFVAGDGRVVFARQVQHPGTRGNDVPGRVLRAAQPALTDALMRAGRRVSATVRQVFDRD